ncbi:MAG: YdcF family protein [Flavobacteriales bacterium]|nr:YdcF family protein [Flavobacteriales bacterium]
MKRLRDKLRILIFKRFWLKASAFTFFMTISILLSNWYVVHSTADQIYDEVEVVPSKKVALVLGAARYSYGTVENLYFVYRMQAAAELYHQGKVEHILVSGDNHIKSYNEPEDMKNKLVELGVPASAITLDFAGFRTFDSMIRAKEIFGLDDFIVVSQRYHLERAIYIANANGINVCGFCAKDVGYKGINLREPMAKFRAFLDCNLLFTSPKFLGNKEPIALK